jgi:protein involved in polysaccharide export with SLBB domain
MTNAQLNNTVTSKIKEVYTSNVNVYASLLQAQPVKVFVTGYVRSPGLYGGVASDSLLSYLSKAVASTVNAAAMLISSSNVANRLSHA